MRTRGGLALIGVFLAGCGAGGKRPPKPIEGPAKEAATVVARLEKATASRDFAVICDQLLSAAERQQAGGADCARLMGERASGVRRPRIRIRAIEVSGERALVRVQTAAAGQAATNDLIRLVREGGRFRIASLGR